MSIPYTTQSRSSRSLNVVASNPPKIGLECTDFSCMPGKFLINNLQTFTKRCHILYQATSRRHIHISNLPKFAITMSEQNICIINPNKGISESSAHYFHFNPNFRLFGTHTLFLFYPTAEYFLIKTSILNSIKPIYYPALINVF